MATATILLADNSPEFRKTCSMSLKAEGYRIIPASSPDEARKLLGRGGIDLAILDVRLEDNNDEKDVSGLTLAKDAAPSVPKIILTDYPTVDAALEAIKPQLDGLPAAVEFVAKQAGTEALIGAIERALGPDNTWLRKVREAINGTDNDIRIDHKNARQQSYILFSLTLVAVTLGIGVLFGGIFLALSGKLDVAIVSTIGGVMTNIIGYLCFQRADLANRRMDHYHQEIVAGQRFQTILQACDGLDSKHEREECKKQTILAAVEKWLGIIKNNQDSKNSAEEDQDGK